MYAASAAGTVCNAGGGTDAIWWGLPSDTYSDFTGRVVSITGSSVCPCARVCPCSPRCLFTGMLQSFRRAERVRGAVNTAPIHAVVARKTDRRRNKGQPGAVTFGRARLV